MSHEKPRTDTARAENSRPTVSAGQVMVSEETLLAFLHGAKPQKSAARTGQYAARGQKLEPPQFAEFPSDDLTGVRRIEGY